MLLLLQLHYTHDNWNLGEFEPRANSNQNRFPLDFCYTFVVISLHGSSYRESTVLSSNVISVVSLSLPNK